VRRRLLLAVAVLASVLTFGMPLWIADARGSFWWLLLCLATVPACEICWRAGDRPGEAA
jgi:type IV secretory pathway TrbD component